MTAVLQVEGLDVRFGGVHAARAVDLVVSSGQLVGLIGPNGAGKTTVIDGISGFVPAAGRVRLEDGEISSLSVTARAQRGLSRTWQSAVLFDDLTVGENLTAATVRPNFVGTWKEVLRGRSDPNPAASNALALLRIGDLAEAMPDELSQGQRKLVGVARALASSPAIVCLDEPAAGLNSRESEVLGRQLREVVDGGMAMLLVDHDMGLVLSVCDHVVVLDFGTVIAEGTPDQVRRDPAVIAAYLGKGAVP